MIERTQYDGLIRDVDVGIRTPEVVFDPVILRRLMLARLIRSGVDIRLATEVRDIESAAPAGFTVTTGNGTR